MLTIMVLLCFGMGLGSSPRVQAQEPTPTPTPIPITAISLIETEFEAPPGPATISVATIALKPGQASLPFGGGGSLLILVESGSVTLLADHEIAGLQAIRSNNASGPGITYRLLAGQRVTIPAIGTILFRNDGDEASRVLLVSLVPEGEPSLP